MLALALSASAAPQDTALTPSGTDARVSWADHPETTLRSQRSRGDLAPAAKSHNTGQVVDFAAAALRQLASCNTLANQASSQFLALSGAKRA